MSGNDALIEKIKSILCTSGMDGRSAAAAARTIATDKSITGTLIERYAELVVDESEVGK